MSVIKYIEPFVHARIIDQMEMDHCNNISNIVGQFLEAKLGYGFVSTQSSPINKRAALELAAHFAAEHIPSSIWSKYNQLLKNEQVLESYVLYHIIYYNFSVGIIKDNPNGFMIGENLFEDLHGLPTIGFHIFHAFAQVHCEIQDNGKVGDLNLSIGVVIGGCNAYKALQAGFNIAEIDKQMKQEDLREGDTSKKRKGEDALDKPKKPQSILEVLWDKIGWKRSAEAVKNFEAHKNIALVKNSGAAQTPSYSPMEAVSENDMSGVSQAVITNARLAREQSEAAAAAAAAAAAPPTTNPIGGRGIGCEYDRMQESLPDGEEGGEDDWQSPVGFFRSGTSATDQELHYVDEDAMED